MEGAQAISSDSKRFAGCALDFCPFCAAVTLKSSLIMPIWHKSFEWKW